MNLIENKTKFKHLKMVSWGIGVYRKREGNVIVVDFKNEGIKKFSIDSINTMLKIIDDSQKISGNEKLEMQKNNREPHASMESASLIQYDGEEKNSTGKNVIASFEGNDSVIFNESYTILGDHTKAIKIHAMYDLTILGDISVQECVVNGSLTIIGTARIDKINCYNDFICKGDIYSKNIYVGGNMVADSIDADELVCDGNVAIQTTANVNNNTEIGKTIVACEGIMGAGNFSAVNAIANEYFEFDGSYTGKIIELEIDNVISEGVVDITKEATASQAEHIASCNINTLLELINKKIDQECKELSELEEEELLNRLAKICPHKGSKLWSLMLTEPFFNKLIDISYKERIETIEEYAMVIAAKEILPPELFSYESIEHVGGLFLPKAEIEVDEITFKPSSIEEFINTLYIIDKYGTKLNVDYDYLMDKIFEAIGIKYSTVISMINRYKTSKDNVESSSREEISIANNRAVSDASKEELESKENEFLNKRLSRDGMYFGLTETELNHMTAINIITFNDLISASDKILTKAFGNKAFLALHLIQVRNKIKERLNDIN